MTVNKFTSQPTNKEIVDKIDDIIEAMGSATGANKDLSNLSVTGEAKFQSPISDLSTIRSNASHGETAYNNMDGAWTIPSSTITICSSQSINGSGTLNYSLSTVLPNDTNLYEMHLLCIGETGSASGNRVQLILGNSNTYGSSRVHAFDVIARSAARVFANNTILFLGHHADTLTVARNSVYTGTVTIECIAYRKVR